MNVIRRSRIAAIVLCITILALLIPQISYASSNAELDVTPVTSTYVDPQTGMEFNRTVNCDGTVIVHTKLGNDEATAVRKGDKLYLDGELVDSNIVNQLVQGFISAEENDAMTTAAVSWGKWSDPPQSKTVSIYKLTIVGVCAIITAWASGWIISGLAAIIGTAVALGYDFVKVTMQTRFGNDGTYLHFQARFRFYGKYKGGSYVKYHNDVTTHQKRPIK